MKKGKDLIWVEEMRKRFVLPGRPEPIGRHGINKLINKFTRERTKIGHPSRAYIPADLAEEIYFYFARVHGITKG